LAENGSHSHETVAVVGGGVIGLWTAYHLAATGIGVAVFERDRVGSGASRGNAGEVCPALCVPLPEPGILRASLRTLHRRDSPLYVRPQPSPELARFLLGFAWNARSRPFESGAAALRELGRDVVARYRELGDMGLALGEEPYVSVHGSRGAAELAREQLARQAGDRFKVSDNVLDSQELAALEPCLSRAAAGFLIEGQLVLDPGALVDGLTARLRSLGVEIREGARVTGIDPRADGVTISTTEGRVQADAVVLAAGVGSVALAATIGVRLPIFPGKGYSFTVPIDEPPKHPILLEQAHVVLTPLAGGTRVAGTMELDLQHDRFDPRRIEAIAAAAAPYLRGVRWGERWAEWVGPRPMTPTGLPLIGPIGGSGRAFVAAGHNMFGLTLAPATGRAVAQLIIRGSADVDLRPFTPPGQRSVRRGALLSA
jgi:D-amino-acid dehydrogenase